MSKRTKTGIALSTKMDKTIVVVVHALKLHPKYSKRYRVTQKFYAHDEKNEVEEGDSVVIQETRPLSRLKRWRVVEFTRAPGDSVEGGDEVVGMTVGV